jgi:hypothetical protein
LAIFPDFGAYRPQIELYLHLWGATFLLYATPAKEFQDFFDFLIQFTQ